MESEATPPPVITSKSANVRTWNVLCHATALVGFFVPWAGHILGPLLVWLAKRGDSVDVDANGKESLNFQISMLIYNVIALIYIVIAYVLCMWVLIGCLMAVIGYPILILIHILNLVFVIVASIQASDGKFYRYPLTIRLIK